MIRTVKIMAVLGFLALCGTAWGVEPIPNLISHWKFDEGSGTTAYDSAGSNDGTIYGATWTTGPIDGALSFDGVDDYVDIGNINENGYTISFWMYTDFEITSATTGKVIMQYSDQDSQEIIAIGEVTSYIDGETLIIMGGISGGPYYRTAITDIISAGWHFITFSWDAGNSKYDIYIDAVEKTTTSGSKTNTQLANFDDFSVGGGDNSYNDAFNGTIDDVRIYDKALSAGEVQQLYLDGLGEVVGLEIIGPNEVAENFSASYTAIAHYNNNVTRDVTGSAQWFVEPDTYASIDDNGLLHTESVDATEDVTIHAEYIEGNITFRAEKMVKILDRCPLSPKPVRPDPLDGATGVPVDTSLRWNTGGPSLVTTTITFDNAVGPWEKLEASGSVLTESQQNYPPSYVNQQTHLPVTSSRIISSQMSTNGGTIIFEDDMESGTDGWTHYLISGREVSDNWQLSTARSASGTTSWYSGLTAYEQGDTALESSNIDLTTVTTATLTFNHWYHFDDCDESDFDPDGGIVEVRVLPGSSWTQIFPTGGYPGTLDVVCGPNPLEGLPAYTHDSDGVFVPAEFDLTSFVGSVIHIRFHVGWDCGNCDIEEGWYIDDVVVTGPSEPIIYDVYFGAEDPPTELIASDLNEPMYYAGGLNCNTTYYWQVVAKNYCSQTEGPVWSFTTISCPALVQVTIDEKLELIERIGAAVGREQTVYEALEQWLVSGDYGDLNKGDIVKAMQKIHSAMQHEEQSKDKLEKSIENLEDALSVLAVEPIPNLIAHWTFDEGEGSIAYDSVGSNDGTIYGATWTTGQIDGALDFDGVNDYVDCGDDASVNFDLSEGSFSVFAWMKLDTYESAGEHRVIVQKGDTTGNQQQYQAYYLTVDEYGKLRGVLDDGPDDEHIKSVKQLSLNTWYFVGFTAERTATGFKLYINGVLDSTGNASDINDVGNEAENLFIGRPEDDYSDWFFDGTIDDVRIYDRALSPGEVRLLYYNRLD